MFVTMFISSIRYFVGEFGAVEASVACGVNTSTIAVGWFRLVHEHLNIRRINLEWNAAEINYK
jgi:hypothetical protein